MALIIQSSQQTAVGKAYLGNLPIAAVYFGDKLIFNGEQWINCLISSDRFYLLSKDSFKLQPKMEA